jgi:hypothetical protein
VSVEKAGSGRTVDRPGPAQSAESVVAAALLDGKITATSSYDEGRIRWANEQARKVLAVLSDAGYTLIPPAYGTTPVRTHIDGDVGA